LCPSRNGWRRSADDDAVHVVPVSGSVLVILVILVILVVLVVLVG